MKIDGILLVLFILSFIIQIGYHWLVFARLAFYKPKAKQSDNRPVSVVIVARNEYYNLINTLKTILLQDYPEFEVVVVNDNSDDESADYLKDLSREYSRLKVVQLNQNLNFFSGKKFPLSIGIKSASYDTLLLTDADCFVPSNKWISSMQQSFQNKTQIVLGYGAYKTEPGFLNKLIRFDTFMAALHYLSFALWHKPYMGVGRNLAYSKAMFYQNNGFIKHYKINSGDDDLFINQTANKTNTAICITPESITYSIPEKNLNLWLKQKKRHLSASGLYKLKHKIFLLLYPISLFFFYVISIAIVQLSNLKTFSLNSAETIFLVLFSIRLISFLLIQKSALQKLKEQKLLLFSPLLEILIYALQGSMMALNIFNRRNRWK